MRALRRMRTLIRAGRYVVTDHGQSEMEADGLKIIDVEHCILRGRVVAKQRDLRTHESKYLVEGPTLGADRMVAVVKFRMAQELAIITVYRL